MDPVDAVVVGSGPNGLSAAVYLAQRGFSVRVLEAKDTIGGGARSAALTLPGFVHDVCSAAHPLGLASPFLRTLPLAEHGLEWVHPPAAVVHLLRGGEAVCLERSIEDTAAQLGRDAAAYRRLIAPLTSGWEALIEQVLGPPRLPRHPVVFGRFGAMAMLPASVLARLAFRDEPARGLFAGAAGHSMLPLGRPFTAAFGLLLLASGHAVGWPVARGGSQRITEALASYLRSMGGEIQTGAPVTALEEAGPCRAVLLDVVPSALVSIAGARLPSSYRARLGRFRHGPGVFKADYALSGPVPWKTPLASRTATVHVGGTFPEVVASEAAVGRGILPERPLVLAVQASLFDPSRAPEGSHTLWTYCHAPPGSAEDMTGRIEGQIERFAPGFGGLILKRSTMTSQDFERYNPNYVGGDISGGAHDGLQSLFRPVISRSPYTTPAEGVFLCSSSTPPGAGVHGMCGFFAARAAERHLLGRMRRGGARGRS